MCNDTFVVINARELPEYGVAQWFHLYCLPLILVFGCVGNLLSLGIMMQATNRRLTCCWYFAALSVFDNIVMIASLYMWVNQLAQNTNLWMCRIYSYFVNLGSSTSCYLMMFITVDRYYAVCRALDTPPIKTPSDARRAIAVLAFITCFLNVPQGFSSDLVEDVVCASYAQNGVLSKVHVWVAIVLFFLLPFVAVSFMNLRIYQRIRHRRKMMTSSTTPNTLTLKEQNGTTVSLCSMDSNTANSSRDDSIADTSTPRFSRLRLQHYIERELTKMMIAVSLAFIFLTLPQYARYVIYVFVDYKCSAQRYAIFSLCFNITNKLFIANNAVNFYLYCMSGAKFRKDFIKMIHDVVYHEKTSKCCSSVLSKKKSHDMEVMPETIV